MEKMWVLFLVVSLLMAGSMASLSSAEDMQSQGMMMGGEEENTTGGSMRGKPMMNPMMMGMMGGKETVVATSDGGVVVLAGPKLMKYDGELNLVKEVEIKKGKSPGRDSMKGISTEMPEEMPIPEENNF